MRGGGTNILIEVCCWRKTCDASTGVPSWCSSPAFGVLVLTYSSVIIRKKPSEISIKIEFFELPYPTKQLSPPHSPLTRSLPCFSKRNFSSEKRLNRTHSVSVQSNFRTYRKKFLMFFSGTTKFFVKRGFLAEDYCCSVEMCLVSNSTCGK